MWEISVSCGYTSPHFRTIQAMKAHIHGQEMRKVAGKVVGEIKSSPWYRSAVVMAAQSSGNQRDDKSYLNQVRKILCAALQCALHGAWPLRGWGEIRK